MFAFACMLYYRRQPTHNRPIAETRDMAYWRVTFKGSLGTVEKWSTSVNFGIVGLAPDTPDQPAADGILANVLTVTTNATVPTSLRAMLSTSGNIELVRIEKRSEAEGILSVAEGLVPTAVVGTGTANKTPQDALVFSLRTNTPGPRGRGRMYWPALSVTLTPTFQLSSPTPAATVADVKTWLDAINQELDDYYISIASALRTALSVRSATDHICRDVTSLQVGSILDTQRRRRDALPESYAAVAYP